MKNVFVIGLKVSGSSACLFLLEKGYKVTATDSNIEELKNTRSILELKEKGLVLLGFKEEPILEDFDLIVVSPGVPPSHPYYKKAIELGIELIGEVELAFRYLNQPCVAITGTNGKTTVTLLVEHVLNANGIKAKALGNVGSPLASYLLKPDPTEVLVVELSSYQLETLQSKVFDAAVLLNITPDHLDRYSSMEEYAKAKCRLGHCIKESGVFYIFEDVISKYKSLLKDVPYIVYGKDENSFLWEKDKAPFECLNALAAWYLCKTFLIDESHFLKALSTFKKPSHRVEFVKEINGVLFYDDSKGTNIDAVMRAVDAMKGPVILIAGGLDKGASYNPWIEHFSGKVKKILVIGQAAKKMLYELGKDFDVEMETSLESAIDKAHKYAVKGDSVLLSPGCASWDMFADYAHRGEVFKQCVNYIDERNLS